MRVKRLYQQTQRRYHHEDLQALHSRFKQFHHTQESYYGYLDLLQMQHRVEEHASQHAQVYRLHQAQLERIDIQRKHIALPLLHLTSIPVCIDPDFPIHGLAQKGAGFCFYNIERVFTQVSWRGVGMTPKLRYQYMQAIRGNWLLDIVDDRGIPRRTNNSTDAIGRMLGFTNTTTCH